MSEGEPGIVVNVPPIGDVSSMTYIAPFPYQKNSDTYYYNKLVNCLRQKGFREGIDLYGASRDWRKSPNELSQHFVELKTLVKSIFDKNNKKVILVGHSMGGIIGYIFLIQQTSEWKNKYIRSLVTIGSPLGGGFQAMYGFLFDDDDPLVKKYKIVRQAERTWTGFTNLMPTKNTWNTTVFIETPNKHYTIDEFCDFFEKIEYSIGCRMYLDSQVSEIATLPHPGTSVYCMGGLGKPTPLKLIYNDDDFRTTPTKVYGDGDILVNKESFEKCLIWKDKCFEFNYKAFDNTDHSGLIVNDMPMNFICNAVASMSK
ncbi:Group XV phospholipase A2-like protein [Leptotrombidium deliense]|uniref:Group XV phospholipase A2-like protein n=1 Tax=Leptotrombidium deliense TaxID=299467 RepID=A0A443RXT1_9ACAR|nr:Group XV phospholipase A2-like protein [Leptotrombidium deliense]